MKRNVLILGVGGTVAMVPNAAGALVPAKTIDEILVLIPTLREMATVQLQQLANLDSTNVIPLHWTNLAETVHNVGDSVDGIIVTHGTDTMAYTAGAVALALGRRLKVPVVLTGSQRPLAEPGTDARLNLEHAMQVVLAAIERNIAEVMIVFGFRVLRAVRTIKVSESNFQAFDSPAFPDLASLTASGVRYTPATFSRTDVGSAFSPYFHDGIVTMDVVPGLNPGLVRAVLDSGECSGLLLKSLGSGNVPSLRGYSLIPEIEHATNLGIPVLVSTKFAGGRTNMIAYEQGRLALEAGAISTGDMTDVMAQVKLMWLLAGGITGHDELERAMLKPVVGEVS